VKRYMLDTCICSFIMRELPYEILQRLEHEVEQGHRIVISAITYAEMRYGQIGKKASPKLNQLIDAFVQRLDGILAWDATAVDRTIIIRLQLAKAGTPIGNNDTAIAAHAITSQCILVTNNTREFKRVNDLQYEDWIK
jgi:tRNA(fMet)-specific endonuclease VapC